MVLLLGYLKESCNQVLTGLSVILCAGHIMRTKDHGYANEKETHSGRSGGGPWARKAVAAALCPIYVTTSKQAAEQALQTFSDGL